MNKIYWLIVFILGVFTIAGGIYFYNPLNVAVNDPALESFAKCVASSGATMYGAAWCPHCQKEKSNFGQYFKYINYVECPDNIKLCEDKKITGYPTWEFADGSRAEGEQGIKGISEKTGCLLGSAATTTK